MKKSTAATLIVLIIGVCLALAGFAAGGMKAFWVDRDGFHISQTDKGNVVVVDETYNSFTNINVDADFLDRITIKEGDSYSVKGRNHSRNGGIDLRLDGDTLIVKATQKKGGWAINFWEGSWFGLGSFERGDYRIEITYPAGARLGSVRSNLSAGDTRIQGIVCETLDARSDFGKVEVSSAKCESMDIKSNAGDVVVDMAEVSGKIVINNDFGKVDIGDVTTTVISLKLNAGDLRASNVKTGDVSARNDFGQIVFDGLEFEGLCEIKNSSGDISLSLSMNEDSVGYELSTTAGSVTVDGQKYGGSVVNRLTGAGASLKVDADFGTIKVKFAG